MFPVISISDRNETCLPCQTTSFIVVYQAWQLQHGWAGLGLLVARKKDSEKCRGERRSWKKGKRKEGGRKEVVTFSHQEAITVHKQLLFPANDSLVTMRYLLQIL